MNARYEAFICHSTIDDDLAFEIVKTLEAANLRCWIAPRDIAPGRDWSNAIVEAIEACRLFVVVFSEASNASPQVAREVHLAQSGPGKIVIPFRIDATAAGGALRYLLAGLQWLDASQGSREETIGRLLHRVRDRDAAPTREPLATEAVARTNVPVPANAFFGRETALGEVRRAIDERPLVSIVGTGGVGKTRLALEAVAPMAASFRDGVWLVELARIVDADVVASTIAEVLGVPEDASADRARALLAHLQPKRLLLLLDNCEHLIDACSQIAARIYKECPHVRVLCTTRAPLNVPHESVYRLSPLRLTDAISGTPTLAALADSPAANLLLNRAAAIAPVSIESDAARTAVMQICRRLDGLPLALELAAARTQVMSFEQIAASIDERFKLLTKGPRTAEPRQQTLESLIAWSYELLDEEEQRLFRRVGVFRGGCTLESAREVCGDERLDEWQVLDVISSLSDKSLLSVQSDGLQKRFVQLESLRDYARHKLAAHGELNSTQMRHVRAFANLARAGYEEWDIAPRPDWLPRLAAELDNFRAALALSLAEGEGTIAADLVPVFLRLSLLREGTQWCRRALAAAPSPTTQARLYYGLSMLYYNGLDTRAALEAVQKAVPLYECTGDRRGLARALSQLAQLSARESLPGDARAAAARALDIGRSLDDERLLAGVLQRCASTFGSDEIDLARERYREALSIFRSLGRNDEIARLLIWWSNSETEAECYGEAMALSLEALQYVGSSDAEINLKANITFYALALIQEDTARKFARETIGLAARRSDSVMLPVAASLVGLLLYDRDAELGALLTGYAESKLRALSRHQSAAESRVHAASQRRLAHALGDERMRALMAQGSGWSDERALRESIDAVASTDW